MLWKRGYFHTHAYKLQGVSCLFLTREKRGIKREREREREGNELNEPWEKWLMWREEIKLVAPKGQQRGEEGAERGHEEAFIYIPLLSFFSLSRALFNNASIAFPLAHS